MAGPSSSRRGSHVPPPPPPPPQLTRRSSLPVTPPSTTFSLPSTPPSLTSVASSDGSFHNGGSPPAHAARQLVNMSSRAPPRSSKGETFLRKLMMCTRNQPGYADISKWIRWSANGNWLIVPDEDEAVANVGQMLFNQSTPASFNRQMNNWGWCREQRRGESLFLLDQSLAAEPILHQPSSKTKLWEHPVLTFHSTDLEIDAVPRKQEYAATARPPFATAAPAPSRSQRPPLSPAGTYTYPDQLSAYQQPPSPPQISTPSELLSPLDRLMNVPQPFPSAPRSLPPPPPRSLPAPSMPSTWRGSSDIRSTLAVNPRPLPKPGVPSSSHSTPPPSLPAHLSSSSAKRARSPTNSPTSSPQPPPAPRPPYAPRARSLSRAPTLSTLTYQSLNLGCGGGGGGKEASMPSMTSSYYAPSLTPPSLQGQHLPSPRELGLLPPAPTSSSMAPPPRSAGKPQR